MTTTTAPAPTTTESKSYRPHGCGKDMRGSSRNRRARRLWLLSPAAGFGGDGAEVPCVHCKIIVNMITMHVDRIVPETQGGSYVRSNIWPACGPCNILRSDNVNWTPDA